MEDAAMENTSMDNNTESHTIDFKFNGRAGEYFKIWIVNIALSILTLGIYSAWAKVRTKRYFYGNTTLEGSSFEYLANPLSILKGRLIVFGVIAVYAITTKFLPILETGFFVLYMIALPWMVIKSMQFNARYSAYRNIRFNFDASIKEAIMIYIALPIFVLLTLGLGLPYFIKRMKQFSIEHSYFGTSKFNFGATTGAFYKIYLKALLVPIIFAVIGMIAAVAIPAYYSYTQQSQSQSQSTQIETSTTQVEPNYQSDETQTKGLQTEESQTQDANNPASPIEATPAQNAAGIISFLVTMAFYLLIAIYIQTRTANLVLCNTMLKSHKLESRLRVRNMFYIYFTNIIAAILSLGLLIPWGKIRLSRYRLENTSMIVQGDMNDIIADEQNQVKATASEFADAFDLDMGF